MGYSGGSGGRMVLPGGFKYGGKVLEAAPGREHAGNRPARSQPH